MNLPLLLQILSVAVAGFVGLMFTLLIIAPALGGLIHGKRFTIQIWHALFAAVFAAVAIWLLAAYGWVAIS